MDQTPSTETLLIQALRPLINNFNWMGGAILGLPIPLWYLLGVYTDWPWWGAMIAAGVGGFMLMALLDGTLFTPYSRRRSLARFHQHFDAEARPEQWAAAVELLKAWSRKPSEEAEAAGEAKPERVSAADTLLNKLVDDGLVELPSPEEQLAAQLPPAADPMGTPAVHVPPPPAPVVAPPPPPAAPSTQPEEARVIPLDLAADAAPSADGAGGGGEKRRGLWDRVREEPTESAPPPSGSGESTPAEPPKSAPAAAPPRIPLDFGGGGGGDA